MAHPIFDLGGPKALRATQTDDILIHVILEQLPDNGPYKRHTFLNFALAFK